MANWILRKYQYLRTLFSWVEIGSSNERNTCIVFPVDYWAYKYTYVLHKDTWSSLLGIKSLQNISIPFLWLWSYCISSSRESSYLKWIKNYLKSWIKKCSVVHSHKERRIKTVSCRLFHQFFDHVLYYLHTFDRTCVTPYISIYRSIIFWLENLLKFCSFGNLVCN